MESSGMFAEVLYHKPLIKSPLKFPFLRMNDLPVIGYCAMHKELWDRQGANIASRWKEMYGEKLFPHPKKGILKGDQHFFADGLREC